MAKKTIRFFDGDSFMEEEPQFVPAPTDTEYDPIDDGELPYMPSIKPRQNPQQMYYNPAKPLDNTAFVDINNIQNYVQNPQQKTNIMETIQKATYEAQQHREFNPNAATGVIDKMSSVTDTFNSIDQSTSNNSDMDKYGIDVAIKAMASAISTLKDIEYWLPASQKANLLMLNKISKPIITALEAYMATIQKMK